MTLQPGDVFAGYTIVRELGAGGMGQVYLAVHPRLPRQVALKLLRVDLGNDPAFVGRFQREAATVAGLDHPNIVPVDDRGSADGRLWLTMPFIDGTNAEAALAAYRPGGMPPKRAVHIVSRVASALEFAHRHQLVHRDVKPANIMLAPPDEDDEPERVYLTDFGVVKGLGEYEGAATSFTTTGSVIATLDYAAPEQIEGRHLDGRTDVYALGCVLYKLLTGVIPFPGETLAAKVYAHLHLQPRPPSELIGGLPPAFDKVVATALATDPADRYQTARALADAARSAANTRATDDPTQSMGGRTITQDIRGDTTHRAPLAFDSQGGFATRTPAGGLVTGGPPTPTPTPTPLPGYGPPPGWQPPRTPASNPPTVSAPPFGLPPPSSGMSGPQDQRFSDLRPPITPGLAAFMQPEPPPPDPSAGRRRQLLLIAAVVLVLGLAATAVFLFSDKLFGTRTAGSSTGVGSSSTSVTTPSATATDSASSTPTSSAPPSTSASPTVDPKQAMLAKLPRAATKLPDNVLLVSRLIAGTPNTTLSPMNTDTGAVGKSILPAGPGRNTTMVSDRLTVIYNEGGTRIMAAGTDGTNPTEITDRTKLGCGSLPRPAWNPADPTMLVVPCSGPDGTFSLVAVQVDGKVIGRITQNLPKHIDDITFAPDGGSVAFWGSDNVSKDGGAIFTLALTAGATPVAVTDGTNDSDAAWSPDGSSIAFSRAGQLAIVTLADQNVTVLDAVSGTSSGPCWSPDGTKLAYRSNADQSDPKLFEIWTVSPDGSDPRKLGDGATPGLAGGPTWATR